MKSNTHDVLRKRRQKDMHLTPPPRRKEVTLPHIQKMNEKIQQRANRKNQEQKYRYDYARNKHGEAILKNAMNQRYGKHQLPPQK